MVKFMLVVTVFTFCVILGACASLNSGISDLHNINECDPKTALVKLLETNIYVPAEFLDYVTKNISYPENDINTHTITCLKVINMDTGDNGGYPEVTSGGIGEYYVEIYLSSQWSQALNFRIEIWSNE